jgi:hypothetical protein
MIHLLRGGINSIWSANGEIARPAPFPKAHNTLISY